MIPGNRGSGELTTRGPVERPAAPRAAAAGSLRLPPASQLKVDFRKLPAAERDGMVEVSGSGLRAGAKVVTAQ